MSGPRPLQAVQDFAPRVLYTPGERLWHWVQTLALLLLLSTGAALHTPGRVPFPGGFSAAVDLHTWVAAALIVNGALGILYHLMAGKIRHLMPVREDFTEGALRQYRHFFWGAFRGEAHPFDRPGAKRLTALTKVTYFVLLNVLIPAQVVTGTLMWVRTRHPSALAGPHLGMLGALHSLGAHLFLAFLILHIYFSTTGRTPMSLLRAMVTGSDEPQAARASHRNDPGT